MWLAVVAQQDLLEGALGRCQQGVGQAAGRHGAEAVPVERRILDCDAALLPADLAAEFTTADLAAALGRPRRLAQQMAYCLRGAGAVSAVGKQGNAIVYALSHTAQESPAGSHIVTS